MIIILDFCNTLVPFNTTFEFIKLISRKSLLFKLISLSTRLLSKLGIFIEEKNQLKLYKLISPSIFENTLINIASKIDSEYNHLVYEEILRYKLNGILIVLNTATFNDFFKYSKISKLADIIIASTYNDINSGENKLKNLINLNLLNYKEKIVYSDSITDDAALFLIGDIKNYVYDGKVYRL
jgi:hypothetical protein